MGIVLDHVLELRDGTVFERREPGTGSFDRFIDLKSDFRNWSKVFKKKFQKNVKKIQKIFEKFSKNYRICDSLFDDATPLSAL